jgi:predicted TIM-barrel fold metal-dependent hydrolase
MIPIVDTHQHLWDLNRFRLPWIRPGDVLARSFVSRDYQEATAGLNVVKSIYMEVDLAPDQQTAEAEYVLDICKSGGGPMAAVVIAGLPAAPGFRDYLARFQDSPYVKGVRQVLHVPSTPAGYCLHPAFVKGIQLLGDLGKTFDLCVRPAELLDAARLIDACPGTRFILDHCGNAEVQARDRLQWARDIAAVAQRPNVVGKISGIIASAKPGAWTMEDLAPIVNHTMDVFGPDRVMFGGDWPVCTRAATLRQWVDALRAIGHNRPAEEQHKLFHDNAMRFYGLLAV